MDARELINAKPSDAVGSFRPGDTVVVNVRIKEGDRERIQAFQGNVIAGSYRKGEKPAPGAMFTVRRVSYGVGVERIFPVCSPMIESVKVTRKGDVRRARLYYLRGLTGRAARIREQRAAGTEPVTTPVSAPAEAAPAVQAPEGEVPAQPVSETPGQSPSQ